MTILFITLNICTWLEAVTVFFFLVLVAMLFAQIGATGRG